MNKQLDEILCQKYPKIFRDRAGDPRQTLMCFGFEHADGWFNIIDSLCNTIQSHVNWKRKLDGNKELSDEEFDEQHQVVAVQVKEKWGGLRFYINGGDDYVQGAIDIAESLSYRTCEVCGSPGKKRGGGWIRTLCDTCSGDRSTDNSTEDLEP